MRNNPLRNRWAAGEPALGAWLAIPSSFSAEIVARHNFDYVCVDAQHGLNDYRDVWQLLQAVNLGSATPVVRVPWNEPGIIGKSLDAGARAVIVPMINTADQAAAAVQACRYAPDGSRSYGPARVLRQEGPDYFEHANADVAVIPMIETAPAVGNLDSILSVPGVDAIYVGPSDLSVSLGLAPAENDGVPAFDEAYATIIDGCRRHGVVPGCHTTTERAPERVEQGFAMITVTSDAVALTRAIGQALLAVRDAAGSSSDSGSIY